MQHGIFISYRRADTSGHAGRISDDLRRRFGRSVAFRDIDSIEIGRDFVQALEQAIHSARVCIVLIGDTWLTEHSEKGVRRLEDSDDHVRNEIEMALADKSVSVIPVLVEGARMPDESELPESIRSLARLQAIELSERRWDYDMRELMSILENMGIQAKSIVGLPKPYLRVLTLLVVSCATWGIYVWYSQSVIEGYLGVWYLPKGSYWTIRDQNGELWIDETHYETREVWKRGAANIQQGQLEAKLDLVFSRFPMHYSYTLKLAEDKQSLIGNEKRSDQSAAAPIVLTRQLQ